MKSCRIWLALGIMAAIVLVGCQSEPERDAAVYRATLNELGKDVIATTLPLAQLMAQGETPPPELAPARDHL
jgi:hypothetical protein